MDMLNCIKKKMGRKRELEPETIWLDDVIVPVRVDRRHVGNGRVFEVEMKGVVFVLVPMFEEVVGILATAYSFSNVGFVGVNSNVHDSNQYTVNSK